MTKLVLIIYQTWHALLPERNVLPGLGSRHRKTRFSTSSFSVALSYHSKSELVGKSGNHILI